ncbi:MAG: heme-binding protein, partial [Polaromonas sp.]|nr:heme-binding protein [Polaromonas sp.]
MYRSTLVALTLAAGASLAPAQEAAVFQTPSLTPETALVAARAALESCRKQGFQVAVAVVDRAGLPQVVLRDRF